MKRKFNEEEKKAFRTFADAHAPKSDILKDCIIAFLVGGAICLVGQLLHDLYVFLGAEEVTAKTLVPITLVFLSCLFTGLGIYEKLASYAGAGTLVPITGFANAVCSCAIDSRPEGFIRGIGTAIFKIAGPVIVYGSLSGFLAGCLLYAVQLFRG